MAKAELYDEQKGIYKIHCPAGHFHYINTKEQNNNGACWGFNHDLEKPTFTPSINNRTGIYVQPNDLELTEWMKENSYICHFFVTDGKIKFCNDCTHEFRNKTLDLIELQ